MILLLLRRMISYATGGYFLLWFLSHQTTAVDHIRICLICARNL